MPNRKAPQANKSQAPWKLIAVKASLDGKSEPAALVSTPEGMKAAPAFKAKDKVNVFEQLSEAKKQLTAEKLYEGYRKWALEQDDAQSPNSKEK